MNSIKTTNALIILDGFGCTSNTEGNAISASGVPNLRRLYEEYPHTHIDASGMAVGLPEGQMGSSEVGHLNIGAGRVVDQELTRITNSIADGSFYTNPAFASAIANCRERGTVLHLMGLCSDGGVHSKLQHLYMLIELAKRSGLRDVFIHCFMDGRDVPPDSGAGYILQLQAKLDEIGCGRIATCMGRFYAMDRDNRYERVEKAYAALVYGEGVYSEDCHAAVLQSYENGVTDEFILPIVITENGAPVATISPDDSVIFFNLRPDRARELTRAFIFEDFTGFERRNGFFPVEYVSLTQYDKVFEGKLHVAFGPQTLANTF
ncbi:MAG: 2,3-bisphosphoglycerate-independent phosphoglycerate mutase, partial [Clostridia bacterium]|nr:2,3-bisphosphoglycerate-independent phosphoglycerate mutase [Clostridia bacterium]